MNPKRRRLVIKVAILPTLFTLGNLLCGFGAIIAVSGQQFVISAWLIIIGIGLDAIDGWMARLVKSASQFGMELDSLADIISFGVAPAFLTYQMINQQQAHLISYKFTLLLAGFYVTCAALRLARYNSEKTDEPAVSYYFKGLPSPTAAGLVSMLIIMHYELISTYGISNPRIILWLILPLLTMISAALMISRIRYTHLMHKIAHARQSFIRFIETVVVILIVIFKPEEMLALAFILYTLSGPIGYLRSLIIPKPKGTVYPVNEADERNRRTT